MGQNEASLDDGEVGCGGFEGVKIGEKSVKAHEMAGHKVGEDDADDREMGENDVDREMGVDDVVGFQARSVELFVED